MKTRLIVWGGFGSFGVWMLWLTLWRRRVLIDFTRNCVVITTGLIVPLIKRRFPLVRFRELKVETKKTDNINTNRSQSRTPPKVTRKFFLEGEGRLLLCVRCYSDADKDRERVVRAMEHKLRYALDGRLRPTRP